jgi:hypothetical protein
MCCLKIQPGLSAKSTQKKKEEKKISSLACRFPDFYQLYLQEFESIKTVNPAALL